MTVHFGNPPAATPAPIQPQIKPQAPPVTAAPAAGAPTPAPAAPADRVNLQLPADQRKCADFDPAMGICKDAKAPPRTKEDVGAALSAQGLPAAEVDLTLKYLDKVQADYGEIGSLIQNQFGFKRDANDVLGAVQAYGVMLEGRALKIPGTETRHYQTVMDGLKDGRVRIDKDTERQLKTDEISAEGHYKFEDDTVQIGDNFNLRSAYARSFLFHELIHTRQDVDHEVAKNGHKPLLHDAEMDAYTAQAAFLVKRGIQPEQGDLKGHLILNPAMKIVRLQAREQELRAQPAPDQAELAKLKDAIRRQREAMEYALDSHYKSVNLEVPADGLHSHHH